MALVFPDEATLQLALRAGLCPPAAQARGARVVRRPDGSVVIAPDAPVPPAALAALRAAGIATDGVLPAGARAIACWAEAVGLARDPREPRAPTPPLAVMTAPDPGAAIALAAELLRLGCDRQELQLAAGGCAVRIVDPPTYAVLRARDGDGGLRVYAPDPPGQDTVFVELGRRHPLAALLSAPPGHLLLIGVAGWRTLPDADWLDLDAALEIAPPAAGQPPIAHAAAPLASRRRVELRLVPGRRAAATLWVMRTDALGAIDRLLAYLPDDVVDRLTFAATPARDSAPPIVVLRARAGRHPAPELALDAEAYAPLAHLPDVLAPIRAVVEPPLRPERLRAVLAVPSDQVAWLAPVGDAPAGAFRVEHIADAAFAPLSAWAEYAVHAAAAELAPWARGIEVDFAPFVTTAAEWGDPPAERAADSRRDRRPRGEPAAAPAPPVAAPPAAAPPAPAPPAPAPPAPPPAAAAPRDEAPRDAALAALERAFLARDAPADAPERSADYAQLARAYQRAGRHRDAIRCLARAAWEQPVAAARPLLAAWLEAELGASSPAADEAPLAAALARALAASDPDPRAVGIVAVAAAVRAPAVQRDPHAVQRWLDARDGDLDSRTLWLARTSLAEIAGGDPLGLARARDRILSRLAAGLQLDRELPSFLRFAGRRGALGGPRDDQLAAALEALLQAVRTTRRRRAPVEAPLVLTSAYAALAIACAFARVGMRARAEALAATARAALSGVLGDPVHAYLADAYAARVAQALAGLPPEAPLPAALSGPLAKLDRLALYKVERLRAASRILEPIAQLNPFAAFARRGLSDSSPRVAAARAVDDPAARASELAELLPGPAAAAEGLLDGWLDALLTLPTTLAAPLVARAAAVIVAQPAAERAPQYAEALMAAGHFGVDAAIPELLAALGAAIRAATPEQLDEVLGRALEHSLRALRRIGLRAEIAELLATAERAIAPGGARLRARLALASGLAYLGDSARARPVLDEARAVLAQPLPVPARLELTRALAQAYATAPLGEALVGLAELTEQLREISDSFATNSHFCLSVLHFVDSIALGVASDELALGESGRRFVDDDEHLIRRRVHRDLGGPA
jgi:hypothetical protein